MPIDQGAQFSGYRMSHRPGADGAPLHDLTQVYPADVYTHPHYYSQAQDMPTHRLAISYRGQPDRPITIYRAVPKVAGETAHMQRDVDYLQKGLNSLNTKGKLPAHPDYDHWRGEEAHFHKHASNLIPELQQHIAANPPHKINTINLGDWVAIDRAYAEGHGQGINGGHRILSKTVPASHIRTPGDSIREWGYFPPQGAR